jgi:hypothetical protein
MFEARIGAFSTDCGWAVRMTRFAVVTGTTTGLLIEAEAVVVAVLVPVTGVTVVAVVLAVTGVKGVEVVLVPAVDEAIALVFTMTEGTGAGVNTVVTDEDVVVVLAVVLVVVAAAAVLTTTGASDTAAGVVVHVNTGD